MLNVQVRVFLRIFFLVIKTLKYTKLYDIIEGHQNLELHFYVKWLGLQNLLQWGSFLRKVSLAL